MLNAPGKFLAAQSEYPGIWKPNKPSQLNISALLFRAVLHNSNVFSLLGAGGGIAALNYNFSSSHSSIPILMEFQKGVGVGKYILWRRALAAGPELDHYQPQSISDHRVLDIG